MHEQNPVAPASPSLWADKTARLDRPANAVPIGPRGTTTTPSTLGEGEQRTFSLLEEEMVIRKERAQVGEVEIRKVVEERPGRLELDVAREDVEVERVPVGQVVREKREPWQEDDVLVVPIYEEQLVVSKRLILKEQLRVRRLLSVDRQLFEETLRRERVVIDDVNATGLVHETYPDGQEQGGDTQEGQDQDQGPRDPGTAGDRPLGAFLEHLVHRALQ